MYFQASTRRCGSPSAAIGVDRLGAQIGDPGIAGAGEPLLGRVEQVDKGLLGARLELLDRKLHAVPLRSRAASGGFTCGCIAELGVA